MHLWFAAEKLDLVVWAIIELLCVTDAAGTYPVVEGQRVLSSTAFSRASPFVQIEFVPARSKPRQPVKVGVKFSVGLEGHVVVTSGHLSIPPISCTHL